MLDWGWDERGRRGGVKQLILFVALVVIQLEWLGGGLLLQWHSHIVGLLSSEHAGLSMNSHVSIKVA